MPALALLLLAAPGVPLARTPRVDDRAVYALRALIDLGGQDDVRFTGTVKERVKAVESGTVTTEVETAISVDLAGVVRQGRPVASDRVERLDGELVTPAKIDETLLFATPRVDRLRAFYPPAAPVAVGASWWRTGERSEAFKAPPFASHFQLEGEEKLGARDVWRVASDATEAADERPARVRGMLWLDKADGSLVRGQWTLDNFTYGPTDPSSHARLELSRVEAAATPASPGAADSSSGSAPRTTRSPR